MENKVLIKLEEDDTEHHSMDSDEHTSDDHEDIHSNDMRMNVAPALTCSSSGHNQTSRPGTRDVGIQTFNTDLDTQRADSVKVKQHLKEKLECPVCSRISLPPIMQCRNGHITCNQCRIKVRYILITFNFFCNLQYILCAKLPKFD